MVAPILIARSMSTGYAAEYGWKANTLQGKRPGLMMSRMGGGITPLMCLRPTCSVLRQSAITFLLRRQQ